MTRIVLHRYHSRRFAFPDGSRSSAIHVVGSPWHECRFKPGSDTRCRADEHLTVVPEAETAAPIEPK